MQIQKLRSAGFAHIGVLAIAVVAVGAIIFAGTQVASHQNGLLGASTSKKPPVLVRVEARILKDGIPMNPKATVAMAAPIDKIGWCRAVDVEYTAVLRGANQYNAIGVEITSPPTRNDRYAFMPARPSLPLTTKKEYVKSKVKFTTYKGVIHRKLCIKERHYVVNTTWREKAGILGPGNVATISPRSVSPAKVTFY